MGQFGEFPEPLLFFFLLLGHFWFSRLLFLRGGLHRFQVLELRIFVSFKLLFYGCNFCFKTLIFFEQLIIIVIRISNLSCDFVPFSFRFIKVGLDDFSIFSKLAKILILSFELFIFCVKFTLLGFEICMDICGISDGLIQIVSI